MPQMTIDPVAGSFRLTPLSKPSQRATRSKRVMLPKEAAVLWKRRKHARPTYLGNMAQPIVGASSGSVIVDEVALAYLVLTQSAAAIETSLSKLGCRLFMVAPTKPPSKLRDQLATARYVATGRLRLRFIDGHSYWLPVERIGMPVDLINWPTAKASPGGESMTVIGIKGDPVPVDSATLRYLVDPVYAAEVDAKLKFLQFTDAELDRIVQDNPAPPEWYAQSEDMVRKSWK